MHRSDRTEPGLSTVGYYSRSQSNQIRFFQIADPYKTKSNSNKII